MEIRLKSDYFRIEILTTGSNNEELYALKSDYFRIEIPKEDDEVMK